jgi:hypothetical protein
MTRIPTAQQVLAQQHRDHEPGGIHHFARRRAEALAAALPPEQKESAMKKQDVFKSLDLRPDDLSNGEMTLTIVSVAFEDRKYNGEAQRKAVAHFEETDKKLPLNNTNWDRIVALTGKDDADDWRGERITLYQDNYWDDKEDRAKPCIRVSTIKPTAKKEPGSKPAAAKPKKPLRDDLNDEIPEQFGRAR